MRIAAASLCALALGCAGAKPAPQAAQAPRAPVPLDEYFKARRYGALSLDMSFSHDDRLAAFQSDAGGRLDLWVKPLDGGPARQVTRVEGFIGKFAFSPADDVLAYEADVGGDELPHLFLTDSNGSAPRDVTADYPKGRRTRFVQWAPDGKTFLYLSNLRDEKLLDFYEYDLASGRSHLLWIATGSLAFGAADRAHLRFVLRATLSTSRWTSPRTAICSSPPTRRASTRACTRWTWRRSAPLLSRSSPGTWIRRPSRSGTATGTWPSMRTAPPGCPCKTSSRATRWPCPRRPSPAAGSRPTSRPASGTWASSCAPTPRRARRTRSTCKPERRASWMSR